MVVDMDASGGRALRESGPSYNLGEERTPEEIAALLDSLLGPHTDE